MSTYSYLDLIQERYPQPGCLKVYRALCLTICGRSSDVDWTEFIPSDWDLFWDMAAREGVAGLVYYAWKQNRRPAGIPARLVALFGASFRSNEQQYSSIQSELITRIEPALAKAGQKLIILKGAWLAASLYPLPGTRPMVDIDCLVLREDIPGILATLADLGYTQYQDALLLPGVAYDSHHIVMERKQPKSISLELHHSLIAGRNEFFNLNMDWFQKQTVAFHGSLLTLTPAAHLLHLAIHLMVHHGEGESDLLHFYDIHLLLERWGKQINWDELLSASREMNLDYAVFAALQGCAERFGTPLPETFNQIPTGRRVQPVKNFIDSRRKPLPVTSTGRYLKKLADRPLLTQVNLILRFAFPPVEFMRRYHAFKPAWLWPFSYPLRWAAGLRQLWEMRRQ